MEEKLKDNFSVRHQEEDSAPASVHTVPTGDDWDKPVSVSKLILSN